MIRPLAFALPALILMGAAALSAAELTVSKVVLYKHGVGFFERAGEIAAGDSATLEFKASEMDDLLKSLTIEQQGGEGVSGVRYDSSDPLAKRLEVFPFRIGGRVTMADILDQLKGSEVALELSRDQLQGLIVSARTIGATDKQIERQELVLLVDGALRTIDLNAASSLRFVDPKVQSQFADYLAVLSRSRNTDKRTVTIESLGGASRVAASYVVPTPIWKSSYRLVFDQQQRPLLEGWAIVDNTSGDDWENVRLSLVSGLPVSFISKLYEPRYVNRPVIQLAQDRAWRPTVHGGAIEQAEGAQVAAIGGFAGGRPAPPPASAPMERKEVGRNYRQSVMMDAAANLSAESDEFRRSQMASTVAATAVKADLGDLFEYAIDHPVTIRKSESAMLPFFRERVEARRLIIYDESNGSQHPLNAVEITNSSGATLDGGAITVYDAGAYAGEALVETVKAGDKRLISYAVDLGTRATTKYDSSQKLQSEFHFNRGIIHVRRVLRETKTFTVRNVDDEAKTMIVEHPVRPGYKLIDIEPAEKTASAYRFELALGADSTGRLAIVEERPYDETHAVTNMNYQQIMVWVRNKELSEAGRAKLGEIAELKRRIGDTQQQAQRAEQRINEMSQDQNRLRSNISTLRSVAGQQERVMEYSEKLAEQEASLVGLRDNQADLRRQADELQRELNAMIETLEF